jgi:putative heme utilization carrier protein HutX
MSSVTSSHDYTSLRASLEADPGQILEQLAQQHGLTLREAVECLPAGMWQRAEGTRLIPVLQQMASWNTPVTLIMHSADAIIEFTGLLPEGREARGFYNLQGSSGLHGHIRFQNCTDIYLIERPFMGKATASLLFCNAGGEAMFKIFAGRDQDGQLLVAQVENLRAMIAG